MVLLMQLNVSCSPDSKAKMGITLFKLPFGTMPVHVTPPEPVLRVVNASVWGLSRKVNADNEKLVFSFAIPTLSGQAYKASTHKALCDITHKKKRKNSPLRKNDGNAVV